MRTALWWGRGRRGWDKIVPSWVLISTVWWSKLALRTEATNVFESTVALLVENLARPAYLVADALFGFLRVTVGCSGTGF